ncbi:nickel pincer cofactor biosynthesis protein LarC [Cryptosporangium aurantiacum]|uniref:Pyridinium-3,5-bisthiocarboxylic acid mononucleotide nickel insertion protein n=1 Tax=Cryptosporangium aurantiacum TaxID=134849 RepID=A0A1M7PC34_9ACTN|nr:nickel pincer cofactor biosynthesis protein LarC [Cryptosporangium aurantiacum]SHN14478.1 hypothetical protein SAMN05443668_103191 [Cryptosporangium aurantiacum]
MSHLWIDASAGVAGDMLLGALLDAGARLDVVRDAVDTVVPGEVIVDVAPVTRAGLRALKAHVDPREPAPPHRTWTQIRTLLSPLDGRVRDRAVAAFALLAEAEAAVHGTPVEDVHFHEVGALDSITDVVGVCAALDDLGVESVSAGEVAVGSGRTRTAHGELPVPVPAVAQLARRWRVRGGGAGELATPTGMALVRSLAERCEEVPSMRVDAVGVGAGARDTPGRANVVRVLLGQVEAAEPGGAVLLEANVDDLDPRLWPGVLSALLEAGASDAWLVPIVMKKGRPAHTLSVLCDPVRADPLRAAMFRHTSTLGVRESPRRKTALARAFVDVDVWGEPVAVKVGYADGVLVQVMPEFEDLAALARRQRRPERDVLAAAVRAAAAAGLVVGADAAVLGGLRATTGNRLP